MADESSDYGRFYAMRLLKEGQKPLKMPKVEEKTLLHEDVPPKEFLPGGEYNKSSVGAKS